MDIQKLIKPAKLSSSISGKLALPEIQTETDHSYSAMEVSLQAKRGPDSTPPTPSKSKEKRAKSNDDDTDVQVSNNDILKAILELGNRVGGMESQLDDIREQNLQNTAMIVNLTKTVQFNSDELDEIKKKVSELEKIKTNLMKENTELKDKVNEQKRYSMRSCLKVKGLKEQRDENLRAKVISILQKIVPESASTMEYAVDVVHRLGKREETRNRHVIIRFVHRHILDEVWRKTKKSQICKMEGITFAEMLIREDMEARQRKWPLIERARQMNKRAYFRGPHAYIEGRRVDEEDLQST